MAKEVVRLANRERCIFCGSAGSIEFDMCQVCLFDYAKLKEDMDAEVERALAGSEAGLDIEYGLKGADTGLAMSTLSA